MNLQMLHNGVDLVGESDFCYFLKIDFTSHLSIYVIEIKWYVIFDISLLMTSLFKKNPVLVAFFKFK